MYQKFLNMSNVLLLIVSTILIFSAIILMKFYATQKLAFWSPYFAVVPNYMIVLGVFTFVICVFGFIISAYENRALLLVYGILLTIAFLAQLGFIFVSLELRNVLMNHQQGYIVEANQELAKYEQDEWVKSKWDSLQEDFQCCGVKSVNRGFDDWVAAKIPGNSVPDSCCHKKTQGCGNGVLRLTEMTTISERISITGCLEILQEKYENDVVPMLIVMACVGVLLALIKLITVVIACAFVAQLTRRANREKKYYGDEMDALNTRGGETVC